MSGIYSQGPAGGERDTTMRDLVAVIFKRKWLILGIFAVTSITVAMKTLSSPVTFSADATLLLNRQGARSSVLERSGRALPWIEVVESEIEVLQSMPVLQRAQQRLLEGVDGGPSREVGLRRIGRSVKAGVIGESNVIYVSSTAEDPDLAVAITNAVAESYVEYHAELFQLPDAGRLIQSRADSTLSSLNAIQQRRAAVLDQVGVTNLEDEERTLIQQREIRRGELAQLDRTIARLQIELQDARRFVDGGSNDLPFQFNTGSVQGSSLNESLRQLQNERTQLQMLRQKYTEQHPLVQEKMLDVATLTERVKSGVSTVTALREHELRAQQSERRELVEQISSLDSRLARLPQIVREIDVLDAQISSLNSQYKELSNQAVDSEITKGSFRDYSVKVLSPAVNADRNKKGDMVRLALGPVLALMAGIGLAFYLENLDHSLGNREDVERHLEIPVLASFPDVELEERESSGATKVPFKKRRQG